MEETRRALKEEGLVETISQIRKRYGDGAADCSPAHRIQTSLGCPH